MRRVLLLQRQWVRQNWGLSQRHSRLLFRSFSSVNDKNSSKTDNNPHTLVSILDHTDLLQEIPLQDIRNFCFMAHIDAGKSSLSSRILELTGNQGPEAQQLAWQHASEEDAFSLHDDHHHHQEGPNDNTSESPNDKDSTKNSSTEGAASSSKEKIELLDTLSVEKERGITVKAATATFLYKHPTAVGPHGCLLLNMYDTPGHVDFGREVSRSLNFCQGAILLVDASQGIQAQTWSVYEKAKNLPPHSQPEILIALTKVDLPASRPVHVALTVCEWLDWDDPDDILLTSARNRIGVKQVLDAICERVPPPTPFVNDSTANYLRAQVVDSWFDARGVNCLVRMVSGTLAEGDRISIMGNPETQQQSYPVQEVGIMLPRLFRTKQLGRGTMGYVRFGLKDPRQAMPGTVLVHHEHATKRDALVIPELPMETDVSSVLYASVHPSDADGFEELCTAVDKLALNDTGLEVQMTGANAGGGTGGPFLGPGLRVGFQGLLHVEVFRQRLLDEFDIDCVVTPPKVPYKIVEKPSSRNNLTKPVTRVVEDLSEWPPTTAKYKVQEPIVDVKIVARVEDAGSVMELIQRKRGFNIATKPLDEEKWMYTASVPWGEVVTDFHDRLKTVTSGYGSLDTSDADPPFRDAELEKVDIYLNGEIVDALSFVAHKNVSYGQGRDVCKKLQEVLPRAQFVTVIQAKVGNKAIASERIKAYRKDVLTKSGKTVGGGDMTRKMKLLEKQKKGTMQQWNEYFVANTFLQERNDCSFREEYH